MPDFVTLSCPSFGADLQIIPDMDRFVCSHCGTQQLVKRADGTISLAPILDSLNQVKAGVNKTASELAIERLREEQAALQISLDGMKV
jgi:hypothetical protein